MKVLVLGCLFVCAAAVPYNHKLANSPDCYGIVCPVGTVGCSKSVKTSDDKALLFTTIQCEDLRGNVVYADTTAMDNPNVNTQISSYSYNGQGHGSDRPNIFRPWPWDQKV